MNKLHQKATTIIQKEGNPRFYIRVLIRLEDLVKKWSSEENKDKTKKMNPSTAKAFTAMKQKIKKHNKLFENDINKLREVRDCDRLNNDKYHINPSFQPKDFVDTDASLDEALAAAAPPSDDSEDDVKPVKKGRAAFLKGAGSDEDEDETEEDEDEEIDEDDDGPQVTGRSKFLKSADHDDDIAKEKPVKRIRKTKKPKAAEEMEDEQEEDNEFTVVGKGGRAPKAFDVTPETLFKKLKELLQARGKKVLAICILLWGAWPWGHTLDCLIQKNMLLTKLHIQYSIEHG